MNESRVMTALIRPAALPVACAMLLTGLLSVWVATGGAGTLRRMPLQFQLAAIPIPSNTHGDTPAATAATYIVIRNEGGPDELLSAQAAAASRVVLENNGHSDGRQAVLPGLPIPAGTTSLSPFGPDVVLIAPHPLHIGATVPLILTFRHVGKVTVEFTVTAPGTP
jgi:copper(I)-binding protein